MTSSSQALAADAHLQAGSDDSVPGMSRSRRSISSSVAAQRYGLLVAWAVMAIVFAALRPETFGTLRNLQSIFGSQSVLLIVTVGLVVPLVAGEFDLSIGALVTMGASIFAFLNGASGWSWGWAVLVVVAGAASVGLFNSLLVVRFGIPSLIATLGVGTLVAGITLGLAGPIIQTGISPGVTSLVNARIAGLPLLFWFATALTVVVWYVLGHTPLGRYLAFVGGGREVARLAGLPVTRLRTMALVTSSVFSATAGIALASSIGSVQYGVGSTFLLPAFAAAFLGSTAWNPGSFNAWGAWIAVFFLLTGITGLQLLGYAGWPEQVFYGGSLLIALCLAQLTTHMNSTH